VIGWRLNRARAEARRLRLALYLARHLSRGGWQVHAFAVLAALPWLPRRARPRLAWVRATVPSGAARRFYLGDFSQAEALAEVLIHGDYDIQVDGDVRTIVDLGANAGQAALLLRDRFPDALIVSVEADPEVARLAARNLSGDPRLRVVDAAIADHDGSVVLTRLARWSWGSNVFANWASADNHGIVVRSLRLGTLLADHGLDEVDLLKIDVEGAELQALTSDDAVRRVHRVVGEVHPSVLQMPAAEAVELIRRHGGFVRSQMRGDYVFELTREPSSARSG
jgi:FkbM family methyltransferase